MRNKYNSLLFLFFSGSPLSCEKREHKKPPFFLRKKKRKKKKKDFHVRVIPANI